MKRIQRSRVGGATHPPGTLHCSRPQPLANPFRVKDFLTKEACLDQFKIWMIVAVRGNASATEAQKRFHAAFIKLLASPPEHLSCWCPLSEPCHVDAIINYANVCLNVGS